MVMAPPLAPSSPSATTCQRWHVVAYCRLRQAFRNFRLDRIRELTLSGEPFDPRPETLQDYWTAEAARHLHDTKHQYGWASKQPLPDGSLEMTFLIGSFPYLAAWLLPHAGAVTIVEPPALRELAQRAHDFFCSADSAADIGLS